MKVYEFGKKSAPALLLLPGTCCHWKGNFGRVIPLLEKDFRVLCVSYDGFDETENTEFSTMLEETEKIEAYIKKHCSGHIHGAYGCSLGGACLTHFLALGKIPVKCAVIDAGITPYQMPLILRRLACLRDFWGFSLITKSRKILEAAYPPERWTLPGCDPVKEYDALAAYLKTYSKRTVRNIFWSANNYTLPTKPAEMGCQITYWYGEEEKQARHSNICFIKQYFPRAQLHEIPKMDHAELVMMYPQEFYRRIMAFLTQAQAAQNERG